MVCITYSVWGLEGQESALQGCWGRERCRELEGDVPTRNLAVSEGIAPTLTSGTQRVVCG